MAKPPAERLRDGVPVLPGYIENHDRGSNLRVWCRWCCHWHIHSVEPVGTVTHRIAHCYAPDSGYRSGGYWIDITSRTAP
jgi:hypothetical protein